MDLGSIPFMRFSGLDGPPDCIAASLRVGSFYSTGCNGSTNMQLWDDIAKALDEDPADLRENLGDRIVRDSLDRGEALRTVLLCESPHHAEISHGHPLAGDSGETITRAFVRNLPHFNGGEEPIGCLLHHGPQCGHLPSPSVNCPVLNSLGLMNVSRLPLNSKAYCLEARRQYGELLCYFEGIKSKLELSEPGRGVRFLRDLDGALASSMVYGALRDDLLRRLNQLGQNVMVVPCGRVAKVFFDWATEYRGYQGCVESYDHFVPHPSRNRWRSENYRSTIENLVEIIDGRA